MSELESERTGNVRTRYYLQYQVDNFPKYIYPQSIQAFTENGWKHYLTKGGKN